MKVILVCQYCTTLIYYPFLPGHSTDGNIFNSSLRLLESELLVGGKYDSPGSYYSAFSGNFSGSAEAVVTLPSGRSIRSDLALSHVLDGDRHTLVVSAVFVNQ